MKDNDIVELYWKRSESAVTQSQKKYGGYCSVIAVNILGSKEDTEECVNDTWMKAWNNIPPVRPSRLSVFFGRITRNLAIDRYRRNKAEKHGGGQTALCLEELAECVGSSGEFSDDLILKDAINCFLHELSPDRRRIFMLRYWYMYPIKEIAEKINTSEGAVKMSLQRTRGSLKKFLEEEGFEI